MERKKSKRVKVVNLYMLVLTVFVTMDLSWLLLYMSNHWIRPKHLNILSINWLNLWGCVILGCICVFCVWYCLVISMCQILAALIRSVDWVGVDYIFSYHACLMLTYPSKRGAFVWVLCFLSAMVLRGFLLAVSTSDNNIKVLTNVDGIRLLRIVGNWRFDAPRITPEPLMKVSFSRVHRFHRDELVKCLESHTITGQKKEEQKIR